MTYTGTQLALVAITSSMLTMWLWSRMWMFLLSHEDANVARTPDEDPRT